MFNNWLTDSLPDACEFTLPGAKDLLLIRSEALFDYNIDEEDTILGMGILPEEFFLDYKATRNLNYKVTAQKSKHGTVYGVSLALTMRHTTAQHTKLFTRLLDSRITAILSDMNGKYWLVGDRQPLKVTEASYGSETNAYQLELNTVQKTPVLKVSPDFVASIVPKPVGGGYVLPGYVTVGYTF